MKVKDDQVFMVSGYTGDTPTIKTLFAGQIIAKDHEDAKQSMKKLIGDLTITGATSLAEMKQIVAAMEQVKSGDVTAPVSDAMPA